jgi:hypothetical protein
MQDNLGEQASRKTKTSLARQERNRDQEGLAPEVLWSQFLRLL